MCSAVPEHRHGPDLAGAEGLTATQAATVLAAYVPDLTAGNLLASPVLAEHAIERASREPLSLDAKRALDAAARTLQAFHAGSL